MPATPAARPATPEAVIPLLAALAATDRAVADAHLVGGCVRDALLGRPPRDLDVAAGDAAAVAASVARVAGSRVVALGTRGYPLFRVPLTGGQVDVTPRRGPIEDDLALRDFTVNAMAVAIAGLPPGWPREPAPLLDPHDGRADLAARVLRAVGPTVFVDDPTRALRAARFAATLGFTLHPDAAAALPSAVPGLAGVAPERVAAELLRLFDADRATPGVRILEAAGLLDFLFPELAEGRGVEQRPVHAYTVYRHAIVAFEHADSLTAPESPSGPDEARRWRTLWGPDWPETRWGAMADLVRAHRAAIRLATLLHDVGKPRTLRVEPDGRTRFFGHAEVGAQMVRERAWRFASALVDRVTLLVEQHLRPGQVASPGEPPTDRSLYRFQLALGDATPDVCLLFLADSLATSPGTVAERWPAYVAHVRRIITWRPRTPGATRGIVDGRQVMAVTGLPPGPAVGRILAALAEAAAAGEVGSEAEALDLAQRVAAEHTW